MFHLFRHMVYLSFVKLHYYCVWIYTKALFNNTIFFFFLAANYKAVRCLALTSLNAERSSILLQHFMETGQGRPCGGCFPRATKFVLPFSCLCNLLLNWVPKMKCLDNQHLFGHCTWSKFLPFLVFVASNFQLIQSKIQAGLPCLSTLLLNIYILGYFVDFVLVVFVDTIHILYCKSTNVILFF